MRIFVFEYVTGGGCADQPILAELAREGDMMLDALIADLQRVPGIQVTTTRDARLPDPGIEVGMRAVHNRDELLRAWDRGVRGCDAVWPIAPESGGVLERLSGWVERAERILLNSRSSAVRVAASKQATVRRLAEAGLPVVQSWCPGERLTDHDGCWVLKPDRGEGCVGARLLRCRQALQEAVADLSDPGDWVVQPYLRGQPASLSLLVGDGGAELLGCNLQQVVLDDDRFLLLGCEVNGLDHDRDPLRRIGVEVARALPGLWGYVGVDLVLTDGGPVILEVNPRLTTSYVGLSRSVGANVAAMVVSLARGVARHPGARRSPRPVAVDLETCHVA